MHSNFKTVLKNLDLIFSRFNAKDASSELKIQYLFSIYLILIKVQLKFFKLLFFSIFICTNFGVNLGIGAHLYPNEHGRGIHLFTT